jgi:hypothetical protein
MQEHSVDEAEHSRRRADPDGQRQNSSGGKSGIAEETTQAIAEIACGFVEQAKPNGFAIFLDLGISPADLGAGPAPRLILCHAATNQVFCPGFDVKLKLGLHLPPHALAMSHGNPPGADSRQGLHISPGAAFRMFATTLAMSLQRSLSALSWRLPAAVSR